MSYLHSSGCDSVVMWWTLTLEIQFDSQWYLYESWNYPTSIVPLLITCGHVWALEWQNSRPYNCRLLHVYKVYKICQAKKSLYALTNSPAAGLTSGGGTQTGSTTFVLMDKILLWYLWIMKIHDDIAGNVCELKYSRFYKHTPPKTGNFHIWLRIFM